ncbi:MAG: hypothetical protein V1835_02295 [Candidatus Micrarchaeota archaeon]
MIKYVLLALLFFQCAQALSVNDQLSLYFREGENRTYTNFFALNSSFYMLFSNCIPFSILEEGNGKLSMVDAARVEDLVGEYIRRGYYGCDNETLDLNFSTITIYAQFQSRQIEAEGKIAAIERQEDLKLLLDERDGLMLKVHALRDIDFAALESKIDSLSSILMNLRRVKSRASIQRLSSDFDSMRYDVQSLLAQYEKALPYYYPAAAAFANATMALRNAQKKYGGEDAWLKAQEHALLAVEAELTVLEKDLGAGNMPPAENFAAVSQKALELQKKMAQRGPLLPWYYIYGVLALCVIALSALVFVRLRTPKKIISEDVPKIHKYLQKLRGIEQQEEEMK